MTKHHVIKLAALTGLVVGLISLWLLFDLGQYTNLEFLKSSQQLLLGWQEQHRLSFIIGFFVIYVLATALSLPGAGTLLTLAAGALFGIVQGLLLVSFASTIGASLAFLTARYLARDLVQQKFSKTLEKINQGIDREGGFYLFTMRLVPLFPFFAVNLLMGLTSIRLWPYYWISQLGMLPGTAIYVNAGTQLSEIDSLSDIASPAIIISLALLGIFPLLAKKVLALLQRRRRQNR